jgi:hypothetical protein
MKKIINIFIKFIKDNDILMIVILIGILLACYFNDIKNNSNEFYFIHDENNKLKIYEECKFKGDGFDESWELGECSVAFQIIPHCKNVIEIGGGAGKVSHIINKLLKERNIENLHLVLEPNDDNTMGGNDNIYKNKKNFKDKYTILEKYANDLTMDDLSILEGPPDCLYSDCEGCLFDFLKTDIGKYVLNNIRFVVNEMDGHNEELNEIWKQNNFKKIATGYGCGEACDTEIWYKP